MSRIGRLSPSNAAVVAKAYGFNVRIGQHNTGIYIVTPTSEIECALIFSNGEIAPMLLAGEYTRPMHECAMAIRATLPLNH